jgi:hypothetical protein
MRGAPNIRDEALDERAAAIQVHGEFFAHLGSYPLNVPCRPAPLGRNDALAWRI